MIKQLHQAYLGELYGIAFFETMINAATPDHKPEVWQQLLQVEIITAKLLRDALPKLGQPCEVFDQHMHDKGVQDAQKWQHLSWSELIDTMVNWVAPYQLTYHHQAMTATEHQALFKLVDQHETCIYDFLLAEQRHDKHALMILNRFCDEYGAA